MYTLIYDFIHDYLFNDNGLENFTYQVLGVNTDMSVWLSHTLTITSMVLIFVFLVIFIKWLFKLVSGLFMLR